jgi:4-hydroxymandelate oxidase
MPEPLNIDDFEVAAKERLRADVFDYYAGAANDEVTLRENREAFRALKLRYRILVDVAERDLSCELFGTALSAPIVLAPTALHRMADPDGERATARAAAAANILMTLSSISSIAMEDVAAAAPGAPRWYQLYHFNDRAHTASLCERARASGYGAIVLTVDAPLIGRRERDLRHPFTIPDGVSAVHFGVDPRTSTEGESPLANMLNQPSINWDDLAWIRDAAGDLPLLLKGIVRGDDAKRALDEGIDGLWVSNHGGRQLDTSIPTAQALPEIVEVVAGRVPVIVDGGVRRGTDVLKGLALGATAVAIGRPQLWGLAAAGEAGVATVISLLREELSLAMALAGARTIAEIDRSLIV